MATERQTGIWGALRGLFGCGGKTPRGDWRKSNSHMILLAKFKQVRSPADFAQQERLPEYLGEQPLAAIERFEQEGMLKRVTSQTELLNRGFTVPKLKEQLKNCGARYSGKKAELIERFIAEAPDRVAAYCASVHLLVCSEVGLQLVEQHFSRIEQAERQRDERVSERLAKKDFRGAAIAFRAKDPAIADIVFFDPGPGPFNIVPDIKEVEIGLRTIITQTPDLISGVNAKSLDEMRVPVALKYLKQSPSIGIEDPHTVAEGSHLKREVVARMLLFHGYHSVNMAGYRELELKKIEVMSVNDERSCKACKKLDGKRYTLAKAPQLPYAHCTCEDGCRCAANAG